MYTVVSSHSDGTLKMKIFSDILTYNRSNMGKFDIIPSVWGQGQQNHHGRGAEDMWCQFLSF